MKKILCIVMCTVIVIAGGLSVYAFDNGFSSYDDNIQSRISDDKLLIELSSDVIDASKEYYYVSNIRVENKTVS